MRSCSSAAQLADENLGARPAKFLSNENLRRVTALRAVYDPSGLFHPWMDR
jgi:FAD/FMN-containing dehydrogenase